MDNNNESQTQSNLDYVLTEYKKDPALVLSILRDMAKTIIHPDSIQLISMISDMNYVVTSATNNEEECIDFVTYVICKVFNTTLSKMQSRSKKENLPVARQMLTFFLLEQNISRQKIAIHLKYKTHSAVIYNIEVIKNLIETKDSKTILLCQKISEHILQYSYLKISKN